MPPSSHLHRTSWLVLRNDEQAQPEYDDLQQDGHLKLLGKRLLEHPTALRQPSHLARVSGRLSQGSGYDLTSLQQVAGLSLIA